MAKKGPKARTGANGRRKASRPVAADWRPPEGLDEVTGAEWTRLVEALRAAGTLDRTYPWLVESAARIHSMLMKAHADVAKDGMTLTANEIKMRHPMLGVINSLTMRLKGLYNDMGLTPASSKLGSSVAKADGKDDPWKGLLNVVG